MKCSIKKPIKKWLGIDKLEKGMFMGVDVGYRTSSTVIITSHVAGGQIRIIDLRKNLTINELNELVKVLREKYKISKEVWDDPYRIRHQYGNKF